MVYPRIEPLPRWRLPAAALEGSHASPGAHAPDDADGDLGAAVRAGRRDEPDPLEDDRPPRRDPGQGVRPRADRRRLDHPRPPARDPDRPRRRVDGRGGRPRGGIDRGQGTPGEPRGRDDRQRRADRVPAAGPRWPAAPQDHAAPGGRRGGRQRAAGRDADPHRRAAAARDDRGDHHAVARPGLGPTARRAPDARRRLRGRDARQRRVRQARGRGRCRRQRRDADGRCRGGRAGRKADASPSPRSRRVRAALLRRSPRAGRSARSSPDEAPDPARTGRGLADARLRPPHLPDDGLGDRRRALGPRQPGLPRPAGRRRGRWRPRRVHRPQGRLGPLADVPHRGDLRGAARAAAGRAGRLSRRRVDRRALPGDRRRRRSRPTSTSPSGASRRRPSTCTTSWSWPSSCGRPRCSRRTRSSGITGR